MEKTGIGAKLERGLFISSMLFLEGSWQTMISGTNVFVQLSSCEWVFTND